RLGLRGRLRGPRRDRAGPPALALAGRLRDLRGPPALAAGAADVHEPERPGGLRGGARPRPRPRVDLGRPRRARPAALPPAHQGRRVGGRQQRDQLDHRHAPPRRLRSLPGRRRQAGAAGAGPRGRPRAGPLLARRGGGAAEGDRRRRLRAGDRRDRRADQGDGSLQPGWISRLRGATVNALWERLFDGPLRDWLSRPGASLRVSRLPRAAWPLVVAGVARAAAEAGRPALALVPGPARLVPDLRPWLAGRPAVHQFAEVTVSYLDRPPAFVEMVSLRLEALAALAGGGPWLVVLSRRALMRMTVAA